MCTTRRVSLWGLALVVGLVAVISPSPAACSVAGDDAPRAAALAAGLAALQLHHRHIRQRRVWTLIDYDLPFTAPRLWVLQTGPEHAVRTVSRVSHAWKSGALYATRFSNRPGSHLSSIGSYVTAPHTYEGRFGHSLRVRGLDPGVNDNAWRRDIVIHPAGYLSHSLGCFMLPSASSRQIIDTLVGGSFLYVHRSHD